VAGAQDWEAANGLQRTGLFFGEGFLSPEKPHESQKTQNNHQSPKGFS
jgi:hypothetical protein